MRRVYCKIFLLLISYDCRQSFVNAAFPKKIDLDESVCLVNIHDGIYVQNLHAVITVTYRTDCIATCLRQADCASCTYVTQSHKTTEPNEFQKAYCFLSSTMVKVPHMLNKISEVETVYFDFSCNDNEASRFGAMIPHGPAPEKCGVPEFASQEPGPSHEGTNKEKRVIGGTLSPPYSHPWLGQVLDNDMPVCGISLIAGTMTAKETMWAVTAAHCFIHGESGDSKRELDLSRYGFLFGQPDSKYLTPHTLYREAKQIYIHDDFDAFDEDVALVEFKDVVKFNYYISSICIPPAGDKSTIPDVACSICGYGVIDAKTMEESSTVRCYSSKLDDNKKILRTVGNIARRRSIFTSATAQYVQASWAGDSGGPVSCPVNNQFYVYGLIYAYSEALKLTELTLSIFLYFPFYVTWIMNRMGIEENLGKDAAAGFGLLGLEEKEPEKQSGRRINCMLSGNPKGCVEPTKNA